jgi:hypothetical protein
MFAVGSISQSTLSPEVVTLPPLSRRTALRIMNIPSENGFPKRDLSIKISPPNFRRGFAIDL